MLPANLSTESQKILENAQKVSEELDHFYLGVEHLFVGLSKEGRETQQILKQFNVDPKEFRNKISQSIGSGDGQRYWEGIKITPRCEGVFKLAEEEASKRYSPEFEKRALLINILGNVEGISEEEIRKKYSPVTDERKLILSALKRITRMTEEAVRRRYSSDIQERELLFEILKHVGETTEEEMRERYGSEIGERALLLRILMGLERITEEEAIKRCYPKIEERDLLLSILKEGESAPARLLTMEGVSLLEMIGVIEGKKAPAATIKIQRTSHTPMLNKFGRDITQLASEGKIDPVIGRRNEMLRCVRILSRKKKSNPVLIGVAGAGKTAIVEGIALRIAQGNITRTLRDKRIIELNIATIIAGCVFGEFEERLTAIINEAKANSDIIIFFDEIHTLVGAGVIPPSNVDAANILKPALASGEIKCIGATTVGEYRRHIERDPALERRFQPIMVEEPSIEETLEILTQLKDTYERHHQVRIDQSAVEAAVNLSAKYVSDRRLPDKAIDAIDEACALVRNPSLSIHGKPPPDPIISSQVTTNDVAEIISKWTGIPVKQLTVDERERMLQMAEIIKGRVIGQDEAVGKVSDVLKMARIGLRDPRHPIGVFLFLGPTGVGKTELAKATAEFLFGSENELIRLDMSEYMERHEVSKLIGAPPGYVGYEEEGQFTEKLRRKPYSVVLLDEIEKAHPRVWDAFLQVFDEGRITDAKGRTINATNAVFIMTSNIGTELYKKAHLGFIDSSKKQESEPRGEIMAELGRRFRPEFLNRIDEVILFRGLEKKDISRIALNLISAVRRRLEENGILFEIEDEALDLICSEGFSPSYGARPLARAIDQLVTKPLSDRVLAGEYVFGDKVVVSEKEGNIIFRKVEED